MAEGGSRSGGWNSAPAVCSTQCTGHSPPYGSKWRVVGGCQSRDAYTGHPCAVALAMRRLSGATTRSPSGAASAPPAERYRCRWWRPGQRSRSNSSCDTPSCRRILKNSGGPISRPPWSGMVKDRPSSCVQRSWLPVWRRFTKPSASRRPRRQTLAADPDGRSSIGPDQRRSVQLPDLGASRPCSRRPERSRRAVFGGRRAQPVAGSIVAPAACISSIARAESPAITSTPAIASSRTVTSKPARRASSTECFTQ